MNFSKDNKYLLLYYQLIEPQLFRQNSDVQAFFVVWDLQKMENAKNYELVKQSQMKSYNFPNSLMSNCNLY